MRMQISVSASCTPLVPSWNQFKVIAHQMGRPTILVRYILFSSRVFTALRRGMQKVQVWREHSRSRWSAQERLHQNAAVSREDTISISNLIALIYASLRHLRSLARSSLQGEIQLCQT
jgi:hypothetical protein